MLDWVIDNKEWLLSGAAVAVPLSILGYLFRWSRGQRAPQTNVNVNTSPSYVDTKEIALDVFRSNFEELAGEAKQVAENRAKEITEQALSRFAEIEQIEKSLVREPEFQHSLYTIQRQYARTGNAEMGKFLVELLAEHCKSDKDTLTDKALKESLDVVPKLTKRELSAASVIFILKYAQRKDLHHSSELNEYISRFCSPFMSELTKKDATYEHLFYTGVGSHNGRGIDLESTLRATYSRVFQKGVNEPTIKSLLDKWNKGWSVRAHPNKEAMYIFSALNINTLKNDLSDSGCPESLISEIISTYDSNVMSNYEIRSSITKFDQKLNSIFDTWNFSGMRYTNLTTVGIAIAHTNVQLNVEKMADLSVWLS